MGMLETTGTQTRSLRWSWPSLFSALLFLSAPQSSLANIVRIDSDEAARFSSLSAIRRYDRMNNDPTSNNFLLQSIEPLSSSSYSAKLTTQAANPVPLAQPFVFKSTCQATNTTVCSLALRTLETAGRKLAGALNIYTNISVSVNLYSNCAVDATKCNDVSLQNILGAATPATFFEGRPVDGPQVTDTYYAYPQALVKQMRISASLAYSEFDIVANFNMDSPFYYSAGSTPINSSLVDFEWVALHELTHGLGLDSMIARYDSYPFLLPTLTLSTINNVSSVTGYIPLSIFDRDIEIANPTSFTTRYWRELGATVATYLPAGVGGTAGTSPSLTSFLATFNASAGAARTAAGDLMRGATFSSRALLYNPPIDNDANLQPGSLFLQTYAGEYRDGSSIAHVDQSYQDSVNFIMTPTIGPGRGALLSNYIAQRNASASYPSNCIFGGYGTGILGMLQNMGYATPFQPLQRGLQIKGATAPTPLPRKASQTPTPKSTSAATGSSSGSTHTLVGDQIIHALIATFLASIALLLV
ncbi:hypothetical protein BJ742DRAFT_287100 [Cladochytrium replicatum]|nr:hypothetical protein BJ742DRAFT_287100 [Cladochytrium replicatum]